jgi:hypothetical protein
MRTVIGTYLNPDGTPKSGYIEFTPTHELVERPGARIPPTTVMAALDNAGSFTVQLLVTDNASIEPAGWKWLVDEKIKDGSTWYLEVPTAVGSLDISYVFIPNSAGEPVYGITGPQGPAGPGNPLILLAPGAPVPPLTPVNSVILRKA